MDYLLEIVLGIGTAIFGLIAPGMLNMTALKVRLNQDKASAIKFSLGAIAVIFLQVLIGVVFAKWMTKNESVLNLLKEVGAYVFLILGLYFSFLAYKNAKPDLKKSEAVEEMKKKGYFFRGFGMSSLNMLSIPFYVAMAIVYGNKGWLQAGINHALIFSTGAATGSMLIFYAYISFANYIKTHVGFITRNINGILAFIFYAIAISTFVNL